MTSLEETLRKKAIKQSAPLSWALDELARCMRLLEQAAVHIPCATAEERGLRMAVEFMLLDLKIPEDEIT